MASANLDLSCGVLVGHSFIRRYRDHIVPTADNARPGTGADITPSKPAVARITTVNAKLDRRILAIYTAANGINRINDLPKADSVIRQTRPDIVVVNSGSNDIATLNTVDQSKVHGFVNVIDFGASVRSKHGVKLVVVNLVVPRDANIAGTAETFLENMTLFNKIAKTWCDCKPVFLFFRLKGFYMKHVDNSTEIPLPVGDWSYIGIHCDHDHLDKFSQRLYKNMMWCATMPWAAYQLIVINR